MELLGIATKEAASKSATKNVRIRVNTFALIAIMPSWLTLNHNPIAMGTAPVNPIADILAYYGHPIAAVSFITELVLPNFSLMLSLTPNSKVPTDVPPTKFGIFVPLRRSTVFQKLECDGQFKGYVRTALGWKVQDCNHCIGHKPSEGKDQIVAVPTLMRKPNNHIGCRLVGDFYEHRADVCCNLCAISATYIYIYIYIVIGFGTSLILFCFVISIT